MKIKQLLDALCDATKLAPDELGDFSITFRLERVSKPLIPSSISISGLKSDITIVLKEAK